MRLDCYQPYRTAATGDSLLHATVHDPRPGEVRCEKRKAWRGIKRELMLEMALATQPAFFFPLEGGRAGDSVSPPSGADLNLSSSHGAQNRINQWLRHLQISNWVVVLLPSHTITPSPK